jgi:hypothetical protein
VPGLEYLFQSWRPVSSTLSPQLDRLHPVRIEDGQRLQRASSERLGRSAVLRDNERLIELTFRTSLQASGCLAREVRSDGASRLLTAWSDLQNRLGRHWPWPAKWMEIAPV